MDISVNGKHKIRTIHSRRKNIVKFKHFDETGLFYNIQDRNKTMANKAGDNEDDDDDLF